MNKKIYNLSIYYLAKREFSTGELMTKLKEKQPQYPSEDFEEVMSYLKEKNYISDDRYIEMFIRKEKRQRNGPLKIRHKLREKKLPSHLIDCYLFSEDQDFFDNCKYLVEVKSSKVDITPKDKQRIYRFLNGKGYLNDHIQSAFREILN